MLIFIVWKFCHTVREHAFFFFLWILYPIYLSKLWPRWCIQPCATTFLDNVSCPLLLLFFSYSNHAYYKLGILLIFNCCLKISASYIWIETTVFSLSDATTLSVRQSNAHDLDYIRCECRLQRDERHLSSIMIL